MSRHCTDDDWESDPFLTANPLRTEKVAQESLQTLKKLNIPADHVPNPETRKAYAVFFMECSRLILSK